MSRHAFDGQLWRTASARRKRELYMKGAGSVLLARRASDGSCCQAKMIEGCTARHRQCVMGILSVEGTDQRSRRVVHRVVLAGATGVHRSPEGRLRAVGSISSPWIAYSNSLHVFQSAGGIRCTACCRQGPTLSCCSCALTPGPENTKGR